MPVTMPPCNRRRRAAGCGALLCATLLLTLGGGAHAQQILEEQVYRVPLEDLDNLWQFLDKSLFPESNPNLQRAQFDSRETFFDRPELEILRRGGYVSVTYTSDKDAAEPLWLDVSLAGQQRTFAGRDTGKAITPDDKHALLSRVRRVERDSFRRLLESAGIDGAATLREVVTTVSEHSRYRLAALDVNHLSVTLKIVSSRVLGRERTFSTLKVTSHTAEGQNLALQVRRELDRFFPALQPYQGTPYQLAWESSPIDPRIKAFFLQHPRLFRMLQAILFAAAGLLCIYLALRWRKSTPAASHEQPQ